MKDIELRDWEHYREYIFNSVGGNHRYIFRGHADRNWKLESTLGRLARRVHKELPASDLERIQLKNFRMRARGLLGASPAEMTDNELWALGQHYGLCTPLLDWTESPYIAAYFAFSSADSCTSGWRTIFALDVFGIKKEQKLTTTDRLEFFEPTYSNNNRIVAQAGLFTKTPIITDLETWINEKGLERSLKKLHIEDIYRLDAINDLKLMNIVGSSIYPDLHGASISCNMWLETLAENINEARTVLGLKREMTAHEASSGETDLPPH